jgi:hypothetical protein
MKNEGIYGSLNGLKKHGLRKEWPLAGKQNGLVGEYIADIYPRASLAFFTNEQFLAHS